uniref:ZAD domain-containing protein n=1 Tax=Stomoxys calcitrans TaxID=35570 RepID=A0A1I8Q3Y5_STOCA
MNTSMRKIFYYENILEFKKSSQHKLNLQEVNNWQLCRTCLLETNEDDMDMEKMCVMDVVHGDFLTVQQMLLKISPSQVPKDNELPTKVCKDCLGKISNLYFFSMQIEKAQYILTKLFNNLKEDERRATAKGFVELAQKEIRTSTTVVNENVQQVESDDNFNNGSHSNVSCSNSDEVTITEEVMESDTEILWEVESIRSNGNQIDTAEMPSSENEQHVFDTKSINKDKAEIKKDSKIIDNELDIIENLINNCNVIDNKEKDLDEELNVHKNNSIVVYETASSQSDSIIDKNNEEYVVMYATQDDKAKKRKPKQTSVKHKQSRVIKPLLENLKCGVCELVRRF